LESAWNKHGYFIFNVTGSTMQKNGRTQADFYREVTATNQYEFSITIFCIVNINFHPF